MREPSVSPFVAGTNGIRARCQRDSINAANISVINALRFVFVVTNLQRFVAFSVGIEETIYSDDRRSSNR